MRRIRLDIRYDGTPFFGWQRQKDVPTVQGELERAIRRITGRDASLVGSGRTDAGVHALGQVAHFDTESRIPAVDLARALSALLPREIAVIAASDVASDFHARYSATRKTYVYRVYVAPARDPLRDRYALRVAREPDLARMRRGARELVGRHDFRSFATSAAERRETTRNLMALRVLRVEKRGVSIFATADGFLQHMVRTLAAVLLKVGDGAMAPEECGRILRARSRTAAPAALDARGLFLWRVDY